MHNLSDILLLLGMVLALIGINAAVSWYGVMVGAAIIVIALAGLIRSRL